MRINDLLLILILVFANDLFAKNHLLIMGGGGEPINSPTTIFDRSLQTISGSSEQFAEWHKEIYFNGGHQDTEAIIRDAFPATILKKGFTKKDYRELIESYKGKLESGEIKSGEKLLLLIDTHGSSRNEKEKSHSISTSDGALVDYTRSGLNSVTLDNLTELLALAKKKGVRVGLVDLSCHSGASLALANDNVCVVSSTGPDHYGYAGLETFGNHFLQKLAKGKSLEETFLEARESYHDESFPMISTPENDLVAKEIYERITPFLYYFDEKADKLTPIMKDQYTVDAYCRAEESFVLLKDFFKKLKSITQKIEANSEVDPWIELEQAFSNYHQYQQMIRGRMVQLGVERLKEKFKFCEKVPKTKIVECLDYKLEDMITMSYESAISYFEKQCNTEKGIERKRCLATTGALKQAKKKKEEILAVNPEFGQLNNFFNNLPEKEQKSRALASEISLKLRQIYKARYQSLKTKETTNLCATFRL